MTYATQSPRRILIGGIAPANAVAIADATPDSPAVYADMGSTREEEKDCYAWLSALPRPEPIPAPEPVPQAVSNQQLRLALIDAGIMPSAILAQLQAMPAGAAKEKALAAWEYANEFRRDHPLVTALSAQLGLTSAQVDSLFRSAATLG